MSTVSNVLLIGIPPEALGGAFESSPYGPFSITAVADGAAALAAVSGQEFDAVLAVADGLADARTAVPSIAANSALLVVDADPGAGPDPVLGWLAQGAQDVLVDADLKSAALARRVRAAIERKRVERASRKAYATDLATGLPHQQQMIEHMSQLLALREREPAPMAVLVLRIEGFSTTQERLGAEAADALRRKIAVRLRAAVRASDVVAAIDDASYGFLLGSMLAATDADRVGAKLAQLLMEPFNVGGVDLAVAVAIGSGLYPADGIQPETLLRKAIGMALDQPAQGRAGMANFVESGVPPLGAANDE